MANRIPIDLVLSGEPATARGLDNVGGKAKDAGDDLKGMAVDAAFLDKRLGELRASTRELATEFARSGNQDLFKQLEGNRRELGQLEKLKKEFFSFGDEAGDETRKGFIGSLAEMGNDMKGAQAAVKGPAIGGAVALGLAMTPFLGAAISGAVLGGVGAGGIIGGLALAGQDARVQDAASKLGEHAMAAFSRSAEPFIAPAVESINILRGVVDDASGDMREAFSSIAPVLVPLARGIGGLVDNALPGLTKGLEAAKPVLRVIANELPDVGDAVGDFFEDIAEDGDGAIMAMKALFQITTGMIRGTGELVGWLERAFETTQRWGVGTATAVKNVAGGLEYINPLWGLVAQGADQARENYQGQVDALGKAKDGSNDFAGSIDNIADSASKAEQEILQLNDAMNKAFGKVMDIQQATIGYEKSWDDAIETLRDGKRTLDSTTEAGRENRGAILDNISAIKEMRDANIANGMAVSDANAIYDRQIEQLRQAALKLGFNKDQVNDLINAFDSLPKDIELELRVKGLRGVTEQITALAGLLGSRAAATASLSGQYISGRASGGPVMAGQTYVVGENGPEVLQLGSTSGFVHNASATRAMMSGASGGASIMVVGGELRYVGPPGAVADIAAALMTMFRVEIAAQGGNVQTVLGGG